MSGRGNDYYIEATLALFTPEEAKEGRKFLTPIYRRYRSAHFSVDGTDWPEWVASFSPVDTDIIQPGESGTVIIYLLNSAFPRDSLYVGQKWGLSLAGHLLGYGNITAILDLDTRSHKLLGVI